MSYDIYIGNRKGKRVEMAEHPDAPLLGAGDISGKGNSRHPGYSQMSNWAETVGLYDMWFDKKRGFLRNHGCGSFISIIKLKPAHLEEMRNARIRWETAHPDQCAIDAEDPIYGRLCWYEFWFAWALKNCARPAVGNH